MTAAGLLVGLIHHFRPRGGLIRTGALSAGGRGDLADRRLRARAGGAVRDAGRGLATWISERRKGAGDAQRVNVLASVTGTYGGLFTAPMAGVLMGLELAHAQTRLYFRPLLIAGLSATAGFAVFYGVRAQVLPLLRFLDFPSYRPRLWHLAVGVVLGLVGAALALVFGIILRVCKRALAPLHISPSCAHAGGVAHWGCSA